MLSFKSLALIALPMLFTTACDDDAADAVDAGAAATGCAVEAFDQQGQRRFPVGTTYWLPRPDADCGGASWALTAGPDGQGNAVVAGADGVSRFTPIAAGDYQFALGETGVTVDLTVVATDDWAFHNYNYYPSSSQAWVGGALWVANAWSPTISVLDGDDLSLTRRIDVGPWPVALGWQPGMTEALVVHRAGDTVGFVDVARGALTDALWVGDEPSNLVVSAAGDRAWVSLATESAVVEIDVAQHAVLRRIEVAVEPFAMALSPDESTLFVATQRSGQLSRYPYGDDALEAERDVGAVDLATGAVDRWFLDVGTTINSMKVAPDGGTLYVVASDTDNRANFAEAGEPNFQHRVLALDPTTGDVRVEADLTRQASSGGYAVSLHGLAIDPDGLVWVAAEASDAVIGLDPTTLEEQVRVAAPGRPRHVLLADGRLYAHGNQSFQVHAISPVGEAQGSGTTGPDPRPAAVAAGQRYFTGTGRDFAQNWGCDSCHGEARTDSVVWKAGPFETAREITRPLFWLEGTYPLGWGGYVRSPRNFAFATNTNIGVRPNTDEAETLTRYLESLMPPPAANGWTRRDGALSEQALRGQAIYQGKGSCAGCHPLPLTTSRAQMPDGITSGLSDIPALVGVYRHNIWLKHGDAATVREAIDAVLVRNAIELTDAEIEDLTRYTVELTARDFFVLAVDPRSEDRLPVDEPVRVIFSLPVFEAADNVARVHLEDEAGEGVPARAEAHGRYVTLTPEAPLTPGARYAVVVDGAFESQDEHTMYAAARVPLRTAEAATLRLDGDYVWTIDLPAPDFPNDRFDPSVTLPVTATLRATSTDTGLDLVVDYGDDLVYATRAVIEGDTLRVPQILVAVTTSFSDTRGLEATLVDEDGDGVADAAEGTLTMTGPGFEVPDVRFTLGRPGAVGACEEGIQGDVPITLADDEQGRPVFTWEPADLNALGFYVTDPGARLPLGPGQTVQNGAAYWALATIDFPGGFAGPITYGVVPEGATDESEANGAPAGGAALEPGRCYQLSVITTQFQIASWTFTR